MLVPQVGLSTPEAREIFLLDLEAKELGSGAEIRSASLSTLAAQLESKRHKLASMPSIWPTRGWLTSRFGYRISPFNFSAFSASFFTKNQRSTGLPPVSVFLHRERFETRSDSKASSI